MIEEQYISFETAKLAKDKSFNKPCLYYYEQGELFQVPFNSKRQLQFLRNSELNPYVEAMSAPTQSLLAKWLREEHNMCTEVYSTAYGYIWCICKADNGTDILETNFRGPNDGGAFDSYEEAKEDCLINALKLINN